MCKVTSVGTSWLMTCLFFRYFLKYLLSYEKFLYENPRKGISLKTKIWFALLKICRGRPSLYHCQAALPHQPVPKLKDTMRRFLESIKAYTNDEQFQEFNDLANEFEKGLGPKLNRYVNWKQMLTTNYISDWWEQYIYLASRGPLMIKDVL